MLSLERIGVSYGLARVVDDVSIDVDAGEWVAVVGANGAGKTSTLRAAMGLVPHEGRVSLGGRDLTALPTWTRRFAGLGFVPEGRQLFPEMTVEENLKVGAYGLSSGKTRAALAQVHMLFPRLSERHAQLAHTLSGGEQQMLAIGRALMSQPSVLVIDEVSWGLMPILVQEVFNALALLNANGLAILQVEQNVFVALKHAKRAYVMATGKVVMSGTAAAIQSDAALLESYIG
jgi:branched-chain amino acid transport system ATP-binding protein